MRSRIVTVLVLLAAALSWYCFYVRPHDERRKVIMDCMGDDMSLASYEKCS